MCVARSERKRIFVTDTDSDRALLDDGFCPVSLMTSRNHHLFRFSRNRRNCNFNCYTCCTGYGRVRLHATKSWRRASHLWLPTSRSNPRRPWPCGLQRQACLPPSVQTRDHTHSTLTSLTLQRPKNHTYGLSLPVRRSVLYRVASARIRHTVKSPCRPFAFFALPPSCVSTLYIS